MSLDSMNPATGEHLARYEETAPDALEAMLTGSERAGLEWRTTGFPERAAHLERIAVELESRKDALALLMAREMGKPRPAGVSEIEKCAWVCRYYAEHAASFLAPESVDLDSGRSLVAYRPLGTVLAIMPWNFPFWQVFRFLAPTLMAGNAGILKHADNVTGCALAIEELVHAAGLPPDLFRAPVLGVPRVKAVIEHPAIRAVTLTGSTRAGKAVAAEAGAVLKKCVLELGGSDPYVVLADADVAAAAETCVASRLINGGQSCISAKRFVVVDAVREEFTEQVVARMKARTFGDPLGETPVDLGPLARPDLRDTLHGQVARSLDAGAELLLGGMIPEGSGAYYPPTVLANVRKGCAAYDEETFGPVAAILPARDEAEALAIANDSVYGLGAAIFTADRERGERLAVESLEAGACFVNDFVRSDPRLPFGGIKQSGYGRELAVFGIREFVNIKAVHVHG